MNALLILALAACGGSGDDTGTTATDDSGTTSVDSGETDTDTPPVDADGDGFPSLASGGTDCDDDDPEIHPDAVEACDGVDNDCDETSGEDGVVSLEDGTSKATIQSALDIASPGETVTVCPGTYAETLVIDQDQTLLGLEGAERTIVDGNSPQPKASTIEVRGRIDVRLEGLTVTGGNGTMNDGSRWGGGVYAGQSNGLEVVDCIISGNEADFGGGLIGTGLYPASDTIEHTVFESNTATMGGGGFLLFHGTLTGVTARDNEAGYGGGGNVWYWDVTADSTTSLELNHATVAGGGLMVYDEGTWSGGTISTNTAVELGGGVVIRSDGNLEDTTVSSNTSDGLGGGVGVDEDVYELTNVVVQDNVATSGAGLATQSASGQLDTVVFSGNAASSSGGGLYLVGKSSLTASATEFSGDTPDDITLARGAETTTYETAESRDFSCDVLTQACTWR